MTLYITDQDVRRIFTIEAATSAMRECFEMVGGGEVKQYPRIQINTSVGWFRLQPGYLEEKGFIGFKAYSRTKGYGPRYAIFLYELATGALASVMDADALTVKRTAGVAALATEFLARRDSTKLGLLGSGQQAGAMAEATAASRKLDLIKVYSPTAGHRRDFAERMTDSLGIKCVAVEEASEVVRGSDIVATASGNMTMTPIMSSEWLEEGVHISSVGSVGTGRVELDLDTFRKGSVIVLDSVEECLQSSQEIIDAVSQGIVKEEDLVELSDLVAGKSKGRSARDDITIFKSQGTGAQDMAAAAKVYELATRMGVGKEIGDIGPALRLQKK